MYQVTAKTEQADVSRIETAFRTMTPSPIVELAKENVTGSTDVTLIAMCSGKDEAEATASIIELEAPGTKAEITALPQQLATQESDEVGGMYRTSILLERATAERLSDHLAGMDPSPAAAVSTEEHSRTLWRLDAFCHDRENAEAVRSIIEEEVSGAHAAIEKLEDKDWVAESLKGLPPVEAGPYYVAGAHALGKVSGGKIPIWIEAGPAFGTGHHGTTLGCLKALSTLARRYKLGRVLDLGTGSGVLSIAAMKSGARSALGTDIDPDSIKIAKENAKNNEMPPSLRLLTANGAKIAAARNQAPYDIVMANILARPLVSLADDIARLTRPGGHIILSGLLNYQRPQVISAFAGRGLLLADRLKIGPWSTLVFRRPSSKVVSNNSITRRPRHPLSKKARAVRVR